MIYKYENYIIPKLFIEPYNSTNQLVSRFYKEVLSVNNVDRFGFCKVECVDLRGVESDGYDWEREVEIRFVVQMRCRFYFKGFMERGDVFECRMRFDEDEELIKFTYNRI